MNGCIYRQVIKLDEMKIRYEFRCQILKKYITKDDIKSRCTLFKGQLSINEHSLDEYLDE